MLKQKEEKKVIYGYIARNTPNNKTLTYVCMYIYIYIVYPSLIRKRCNHNILQRKDAKFIIVVVKAIDFILILFTILKP